MELTQDEKKLIECIRTLSFVEVLEVGLAIDQKITVLSQIPHESALYVDTTRINALSDLLCDANENYKKEVSILDQD